MIEQNQVLTVKNLTVTLDSRTIIENLSFGVARGEVLTILGPNGAGKTVLLRALLGLLPYKGYIEWQKGVKIGYVPQRLPFIKDIPMTVRNFFELKGCPKRDIEEVMASIGLKKEMLERKAGALSSGQFQKVLIAWSLFGKPDILLFDEPTTGIDIAGEESVYSLLGMLQRERNLTMLLVTHDLSIVYNFSTRVLCLSRHLVCYGIPDKVLTPESLKQLYNSEVKYYQHKHD